MTYDAVHIISVCLMHNYEFIYDDDLTRFKECILKTTCYNFPLYICVFYSIRQDSYEPTPERVIR